jgi:anti-sigma B factor antagonist
MTPTDYSTGLEFWASLADRPGGGSIVTVFGELDVSTAPKLRATLEQALGREGDVEIDLRGCGFVDSSGIATLVWMAVRMKERDRGLVLLGARERVRRILDLAGIAGHSAVEIKDAPSADAG